MNSKKTKASKQTLRILTGRSIRTIPLTEYNSPGGSNQLTKQLHYA